MINYNAGDIILVQFPFTNYLQQKKRPAVIISSAKYQQSKQDVIIMAVTSQIRTPIGFGEVIIQDWKAAHLLSPSVIKPVTATIKSDLILRRLGQLSAKDSNALQQAIDLILM